MSLSRRRKQISLLLSSLRHTPGPTNSSKASQNEIRDLLSTASIAEFLSDYPYEEDAIVAYSVGFLRRLDWMEEVYADLDRDEERARFLTAIKERMEAYRDFQEMIAPIYGRVGQSRGLEPPEPLMQRFEIHEYLRRLAPHKEALRRIADLLGRLDEAQDQRRKRRSAAAQAPEWKAPHAGVADLVGLSESDRLSDMISVEAGLLARADSQRLLLLKFAEKKLLTYDYSDQNAAAQRKGRRLPRARKRRGPLILCLDTSGSMLGGPDQQAKALALALSRIALSQRRSVHVMSFSTDTRAATFVPPGARLSDLIEFLMCSLTGGTDIGLAMQQSLKMLRAPRFRRADVIFLTDGAIGRFTEKQMEAVEQARKSGSRFCALFLAQEVQNLISSQFDYAWRYDESRLEQIVDGFDQFHRGHAAAKQKGDK